MFKFGGRRTVKPAHKFVVTQFPRGVRAFGVVLLFLSPVLAALIYQRTLAQVDKMTYHLPSIALGVAAMIAGYYAVKYNGPDFSGFDKPEPDSERDGQAWLIRRDSYGAKRRKENEWKQNLALGIFAILMMILYAIRDG